LEERKNKPPNKLKKAFKGIMKLMNLKEYRQNKGEMGKDLGSLSYPPIW